MLKIEHVDVKNKAQVNRFIQVPFRIYGDHPQWVPPIIMDIKAQMNPDKHPFYEHSQADFYLAVRDGRDVGRICALVNNNSNQYHDKKIAQFYFFECEDDLEAATALFEQVFEWARQRGLDKIVGPKGFGPLDGYGMVTMGYEHRQMMTMMNYNFPYYVNLVEALGFTKEVDFLSCLLERDLFQLPERIHSIAGRVQERGVLRVLRFQTKGDLKRWAKRIGKAYNDSFINNWEYVPLTDREIGFVLENILTVADPRLIKVIAHEDQAVGFLFGFPDVSAALQRTKGRLFPFGIFDLMREIKRTDWCALNGAGILPEFQGRGGNALLYSEMEKTFFEEFNFKHVDMTQVAETAVQMRQDLVNLRGTPYKNHRVYQRVL